MVEQSNNDKYTVLVSGSSGDVTSDNEQIPNSYMNETTHLMNLFHPIARLENLRFDRPKVTAAKEHKKQRQLREKNGKDNNNNGSSSNGHGDKSASVFYTIPGARLYLTQGASEYFIDRCAQHTSQSKLYQCVRDVAIPKNKRVLQQTHPVYCNCWYTSTITNQ